MQVRVAPHPLLDAGAFVTELAAPLDQAGSPPWIEDPPLQADDAVRAAVRDLLRHGGFKPTGRSKPSSEYLVRAAGEGGVVSINLAVDTCNLVSLYSGLPISVVDLDRTAGALCIAIAPRGASYVFNASGQVIDLSGLVCLFDGEGPCANPVKDSQRTKTHGGTRRTLSIVWGTKALGDRTARTVAWYRELLAEAGATTMDAALVAGAPAE